VYSIHQHEWLSSYAMTSRKPAAMCLDHAGLQSAMLSAVKGLFGIRPERVM
jgi:hypothetical protein